MRAKIKPVQSRPLRSRDTGKAKALRQARDSHNREEVSKSVCRFHGMAPHVRLTATGICSDTDFIAFDLEQAILLGTSSSEKPIQPFREL